MTTGLPARRGAADSSRWTPSSAASCARVTVGARLDRPVFRGHRLERRLLAHLVGPGRQRVGRLERVGRACRRRRPSPIRSSRLVDLGDRASARARRRDRADRLLRVRQGGGDCRRASARRPRARDTGTRCRARRQSPPGTPLAPRRAARPRPPCARPSMSCCTPRNRSTSTRLRSAVRPGRPRARPRRLRAPRRVWPSASSASPFPASAGAYAAFAASARSKCGRRRDVVLARQRRRSPSAGLGRIEPGVCFRIAVNVAVGRLAGRPTAAAATPA